MIVMERVLNYADHKKDFCGELIDFTMEAEENQKKVWRFLLKILLENLVGICKKI